MARRKKNQIRGYGPGKFSSMIDSYVYEDSLDRVDEEVGSATEPPFLWSGKVEWDGRAEACRMQKDHPEITDAELDVIRKDAKAGVILLEDERGFVQVNYYKTKRELDKAWDMTVEDLTVEENPRSNPDAAAAKRRCMR